MSKSCIKVLPIHVANKISAGEVVERPASVVKELVENAIDAGAKNIRISIAQGGKSLISVQDDGCGMSKDDALLSLERQATSKITDEADIENISTLGFRGEAIPSIASVSRFSMTTRLKENDEGFFLQVNAGALAETRVAGCPVGTLIEVKDLFCNVPGRLKFLKSKMTEESHVRHVYTVHALSRPDIAFSLYVDGREAGKLPAAASLAERMHDLFGAEFMESLNEIPLVESGEQAKSEKVKVTGFIEKPSLACPTRRDQYIFVNSRPATAPSIAYAIRETYPRRQGESKPAAVLFIETSPSEVDVNVHPMKREVRFRDNNAVKSAVSNAIKRTILFSKPATIEKAPPEVFIQPAQQVSEETNFTPPPLATHDQCKEVVPSLAQISTPPKIATPQPQPVEVELKISSDGENAKPWRWFKFLAQTQSGYILLETDAGIVTVNPTAARERIVYEQMRDMTMPTQPLLIPETVALSPADSARIASSLKTLESMGFSIEPFGKNTFKIDAVPQIASNISASALLSTICHDLSEGGSRNSGIRWKEELIARSVARSFAGSHQKISAEGAVEMMEELCSCKMPYVCPRGKSVMIFTSNRELDRKFDRR